MRDSVIKVINGIHLCYDRFDLVLLNLIEIIGVFLARTLVSAHLSILITLGRCFFSELRA